MDSDSSAEISKNKPGFRGFMGIFNKNNVEIIEKKLKEKIHEANDNSDESSSSDESQSDDSSSSE